MSTACAIPGCVALATRGPNCAIHGRSTRYDLDTGRCCERCGKRFKTGDWLMIEAGREIHTKPCKPKPV